MLELLAALAKFGLYAGSLTAAGAVLASLSLSRWLGAARLAVPALVAIPASIALVATLAGAAILFARLGGELDGPTLSAIWETPAGPAILLQLFGAVALLATSRTKGVFRILQIPAAACALATFGINGHAPSTGDLGGLIAFGHVCAASWWLGSLFLLREAGNVLPEAELSLLVRRFSMLALIVVGALVVGGVVLTLTLVDFSRPEWLTPYAQALALKVALVGTLLGLAAWNKLRITPRLALADGSGARALNHTIGIELGVFAAVFFATAWLTTFNSPHE